MSVADQDQNQYHMDAYQSYIHSGRAVDPVYGSYVHQMENALTSGVSSAFPRNLDCGTNEHSLSSFSMQRPCFQAAVPGPSHDPFSHLSAAGTFYRTQENNASHARSTYYNRSTIHEVEGGSQDPAVQNSRGPFKRKSPSISIAYERGIPSRFYDAGSSSGFSEFHLDKPTLDYQNYFYGPGLSHYGASSLSISGEASLRNVRRRSRFEWEPNRTTGHLSSYSSHYYCPTTNLINHSSRVDLANLTANSTTYERSHTAVPPAGYGRFLNSETNGLSHETDRFVVGRSTVDISGYHHGSVSSRFPISLPQYLHGLSGQSVREGHSSYSQRFIPSYRSGLSYPHLGHEAAHSENGLQFPSETFSSRYPRPSAASGWRNSYRNERSRIASERYQSLSNAADTHAQMESEAVIMVDSSSLYGSRNLFDQYGDMRLDIDDMSYEELLALGESIGNVSTGLSEDMVSKCLTKTTYHSSDQNQEEAMCTICLEEYKSKEEVGRMKNCGHDYHVGCIRKWLSLKNSCAICKAPALADGLKEE